MYFVGKEYGDKMIVVPCIVDVGSLSYPFLGDDVVPVALECVSRDCQERVYFVSLSGTCVLCRKGRWRQNDCCSLFCGCW